MTIVLNLFSNHHTLGGTTDMVVISHHWSGNSDAGLYRDSLSGEHEITYAHQGSLSLAASSDYHTDFGRTNFIVMGHHWGGSNDAGLFRWSESGRHETTYDHQGSRLTTSVTTENLQHQWQS